MATNTLDVLDANIIVLPSEPLLKLPNLATMFDSGEFAQLLRQPLALSQGVSIETASGAALQNYTVESIRSQKTVSFSPARIEVHDRSGAEEVANTSLPELLRAVVKKLDIGVKAVGVNYEASLPGKEGETAASVISTRMLTPKSNVLPPNMGIIGAGVRYFFGNTGDDEAEFTVGIEPRGIDRATDVIWMSCNVQLSVTELPSEERLKALIERCQEVVLHIRDVLGRDGV